MEFKELPQDGQAFEQLVRELVFSLGLHVAWSGRGSDGGRDLICRETLEGVFGSETRTWLVQCKHNAHSGASVGVADLDDIVTSCEQHGATGYVLACSTQPSSAVVARLEGVTKNPGNRITATYWDGVTIERLLSQPRQWAIAQRFMPVSSGDWRIYATQEPNDFVAHYRGYYFHLSNRHGSQVGHQLKSIAKRIAEIEALELPKGHFVRPRAVWYDDKNGGYVWYVDYMRPHKERPAVSIAALQYELKDGWALDDGQVYSWDIKAVTYFSHSDSYDDDHYTYYTWYLPNFLMGARREQGREDFSEYWATKQEMEIFETEAANVSAKSFEPMVSALKRLPFLRLLRSANATPELLPKMERRYHWNDLLEEGNGATENFLSATLVLEVLDEKRFFAFLNRIPNDVERHFRAGKVAVLGPDGFQAATYDPPIWDIQLSLHPMLITNQREVRAQLNAYFDAITQIALELEL